MFADVIRACAYHYTKRAFLPCDVRVFILHRWLGVMLFWVLFSFRKTGDIVYSAILMYEITRRYSLVTMAHTCALAALRYHLRRLSEM